MSPPRHSLATHVLTSLVHPSWPPHSHTSDCTEHSEDVHIIRFIKWGLHLPKLGSTNKVLCYVSVSRDLVWIWFCLSVVFNWLFRTMGFSHEFFQPIRLIAKVDYVHYFYYRIFCSNRIHTMNGFISHFVLKS